MIPLKWLKLVVGIIAQLINKLEYHWDIFVLLVLLWTCALDCPEKIDVLKMFWIKPTTITTIVAKSPKPDNVPINVVMTHESIRTTSA